MYSDGNPFCKFSSKAVIFSNIVEIVVAKVLSWKTKHLSLVR